jgi:hypothetical protein
VSTQQRAIIEKAVTQKLIVASLDAYVLTELGSLVNKRSQTLGVDPPQAGSGASRARRS